MLATRIALLAGVAALVGCSSTAAPDNTTRSAGITQAVAAFYPQPAAGGAVIDGPNGGRNAKNGEQVQLTIAEGTSPANGAPGTPATATLVGVGGTATSNLALNEMVTASGTTRGGVPLTRRIFGTGMDVNGQTMLDRSQSSLVVLDAEYARIAAASLRADAPGGQEARSFIVGPKAADTARAVPTAGTATYTGFAQGASLSPAGNEDLTGDITLNADFGAGTVAGTVTTGTETRVDLTNGRITGVDYAGDATLVDTTGATTYSTTGRNGNGRSAFRGGFYGPNAEETAGVVDFSGVRTNAAGEATKVDAFGNYIATK